MNYSKRKMRKSTAIVVSFIMTITLLSGILLTENTSKSQAAGYGISSHTINANGLTTWDTVYFGNYYQNDAKGKKKEPIRWRVLSVNGDDAFLLADQNLEAKPYNIEHSDATWENCTLRKWLNSIFLTTAFTSVEQAAIKNTTVVNEDNPYYGTDGGNDTTDKVYLLSIAEVCNTSYGFNRELKTNSKTREARNTAYVAEKNVYMAPNDSTDCWRLRSPGSYAIHAVGVYNNGYVYGNGFDVFDYNYAVRPALHLNLSASTLWTKGERVVVEDGGDKTKQMATPTSGNGGGMLGKFFPKKWKIPATDYPIEVSKRQMLRLVLFLLSW